MDLLIQSTDGKTATVAAVAEGKQHYELTALRAGVGDYVTPLRVVVQLRGDDGYEPVVPVIVRSANGTETQVWPPVAPPCPAVPDPVPALWRRCATMFADELADLLGDMVLVRPRPMNTPGLARVTVRAGLAGFVPVHDQLRFLHPSAVDIAIDYDGTPIRASRVASSFDPEDNVQAIDVVERMWERLNDRRADLEAAG